MGLSGKPSGMGVFRDHHRGLCEAYGITLVELVIGMAVIYTYEAGACQILRNSGNGDEPVTSQMTTFTCEYFDANGTPTTVSANIRQLRITLTAHTAKPDRIHPINGGYRT